MSPIEQIRQKISKNTISEKKSLFGQFLTPSSTAKFMANLFLNKGDKDCYLLDPGAGIGSLSSAFLDRCIAKELHFNSVHVSAYEIDDALREELIRTFSTYNNKINFTKSIVKGDFIEHAVDCIKYSNKKKYTHAILNPPYKKINSSSNHRKLLRQVGIETVNLYTAFLALTFKLMLPGGQIVAIIPRSFCNGPYYKSFRKMLLENVAIHYMHLFESRSKAFKDDDVLQENIIIMMEKYGKQANVKVSTSTDDTFEDIVLHEYDYEKIVDSNDSEVFIHIPISPESDDIEKIKDIRYSIDDLGINVSTGPVVDFRVKEYLYKFPEPGTVPLLYPAHFNKLLGITWPKSDFKRWNAIFKNSATEKWLYSAGNYCVVRRFSSKEEKRRVIPGVVTLKDFPGAFQFGFENHLNVFHLQKQGLSRDLAIGLAVYLNTSMIDKYFRRFSGHTQVNATDLKTLKYPNHSILIALGKWAEELKGDLTQTMIDKKMDELVT